MTRLAPRLRLAAGLVAASALVALPALPAAAHDSLVASSPASGATVTAPPRAVTLTFDEPVLDYAGTSALIVTGPSGERHFETGCVRIDGRTATAPVALGTSGRYTVTWRVVSADGHPVSDSFAFTLDRPAGTTAAAGSATGPACGRGSSSAAAPAASTGSSSGSVSPAVWALIGVGGGLVLVLLIVVAVLAVHLSRRGARTGAGADRSA